MLVDPEYPDAVKARLAEATLYFREDVPELVEALSVLPCLAVGHLRPFVNDRLDLQVSGRGGVLAWYRDAVWLLANTVSALAVRPQGQSIIRRVTAAEENSVLANQIGAWAARADTVTWDTIRWRIDPER